MRSKPKRIKSPTQKEFPCYQAYIRQNEKTAPHISVPVSIIKTNISALEATQRNPLPTMPIPSNYFSYYFSKNEEYKFDIDDLFFYSQHKILRRGGRLFVNEYGMQTSIFSRYGIPSHGVPGRDFTFANGDSTDLRYSNVILLNSYHGVIRHVQNGMVRFKARIHINGNYIIGSYSTPTKAAVAYNKAVDLAKRHGIAKNFPENYVEELSAKEYAELYTKIKISKKFLAYLDSMSSISD